MRRSISVLALGSWFLALSACSSSENEGISEDVVYGPEAEIVYAIPDQFLGQWDQLFSECSPDSEYFIEIFPKQIAFQESTGKVIEVRILESGRVSALLQFSVQGKITTRAYRLWKSDSSTIAIELDTEAMSGHAEKFRQHCGS